MEDRQLPDPTSSAWALFARRMRRHREKAGLTQEDVAREVIVSPKLYGHYENCRRMPTMDVAKQLDRLYGLEEDFQELRPLVLKELELPPEFIKYAEEEASAESIRSYHPFLIPGILQHEDYARTILSAAHQGERLERLLVARMSRQEILDRGDPPWLFVVLHELALQNTVGGPEVMKSQLGYLLELQHMAKFSIHVLPIGAPVYASGAFNLLTFPEGGDIGLVSAACGNDKVILIPERVKSLAVRWEQIKNEALPSEESQWRIRGIMESL